MKKIIIFFVFFICLSVFTGCQSEDEQLEDTYILGNDYQYMYVSPMEGQEVAESPDGYYFMVGNFLYYMDKTALQPVVLCNKPNCLHEEETDPSKIWKCNAYFIRDSRKYLTWYDGYVYIHAEMDQEANRLGNGGGMMRISPDGITREIVCSFSEDPFCVAIHRGKIYYATGSYDNSLNTSYNIYSLDLARPTEKESLLYKGDKNKGSFQSIDCYGNHLYFRELYEKDEQWKTSYLHFDLLTKKFTDMENDLSVRGYYENKLCVMYNVSEDDYNSPENRKVWNTNLNGTGKKEELLTIDNDMLFTSDGTYIYEIRPEYLITKPEQKIEIKQLDKQGNNVAEVDLDSLSGRLWTIVPGGGNEMFLISSEESYRSVYTVDKTELEKNGTAKPVLRKKIDISNQNTITY